MTPKDQPTAPKRSKLYPRNRIFASLFALKTTIFHHGNAKRVHRVALNRPESPFSATGTLNIGGGGGAREQPTPLKKSNLYPKIRFLRHFLPSKRQFFTMATRKGCTRWHLAVLKPPFLRPAPSKWGGGVTPQDQPTAPQKIQLVPKNQVFASLFALKTAIFHHGNAERVHRVAPSRFETPFSATATLKMGGGGGV